MRQQETKQVTGASALSEVCIHQLVEAQVARTPDAVALLFEEAQLTYRELNQRANQLAHHLRQIGVGPEVLVGLCLERSLNMVVGLLGILKAGGAYVPLDPTYPPERIAFMLEDAQVPVLVTQQHLARHLPIHRAQVVCLDSQEARPAQQSEADLVSPATSENLAYVIYTSGSTGRPKGVQIVHRAVVNFLRSMRKLPGLTAEDTLLAVTTLSFDIAALELFLPLVVGARLRVASRDVVNSGTALAQTLDLAQATVMQATPITWRLLLEAGWQPPRGFTALCGGEALPQALASALLARGVTLWNMYGPTETTIWSSCEQITSSTAPLSIGRPIANTQFYVLSADLQLLPPGEEGELCIGGAGLARGYLNRPELTAERFIPDHVTAQPGARLYRTGDLARQLPDGRYVHLGRLDQQVKVRGFRMEPGEIEAILDQSPDILQSAVVAQADESGDKRLVAYIVARSGQAPTHDGVRRTLREFLPDYMVPAVFVVMEALPQTPNGKVDRKALQGMEPEQLGRRLLPGERESTTRADLQGQLREIFAAVLGYREEEIERVGNLLLELDSLKLAQCASRIAHATQLDINVVQQLIVLHPTVRDLASSLLTVRLLDATALQPRTRDKRGAVMTGSPPASLPFVTRYEQNLFALILEGRLPRIQAAALTYAPALYDAERLLLKWSHGEPVLTHIIETHVGRVGLFALPLTSLHLYQRRDDLLALSVKAMQMTRMAGAQTVALTGLLSSALGYGRDLVQAMAGQADLPTVTTGHAVTLAAVIMTIGRLLSETGRDLTKEVVACIGLGSIGWTALRLLLQVFPHPRRLFLCDLVAKREALEGMRRQLHDLDFRGDISTAVALEGAVPDEVYEQATLLIGATNVANVVDVERLQPGCLLVDDSAPHCFRSDQAWERAQRGDLLVTEGGELRIPNTWPKAMSEVRYVPRISGQPGIEELLLSEEMIALRANPRQIMGCLVAGLIASALQLPTTLGLVELPVALEHYHALWRAGFRAADPHLENRVLTPAYVQAYRERFGTV